MVVTFDDVCVITLKTGQKVFCNIFANKEKGRIRAVAVGCEDLAFDSIERDSVFRSVCCLEIEEHCRLDKQMTMNDSYVGTAKLAPGDTYDYKEGVKIAVNRLKEKLEQAIASRRHMLAKELCAMALRLDNI